MTRPRVAAVGGVGNFSVTVARALGSAPDDVIAVPSTSSAERAIAEGGRVFDVLVLAPTVAEGDAASIARFVEKETPTTAVVVVRDAPVDGAYPRLIRSGARDVVDLSTGTAELRDALLRALEWTSGLNGSVITPAPPATRGRIVAVFSTKGGTGKTFLTTNLAAAMAERSKQTVALVDLDHDLGDVFAYFGAAPKRTLPELLLLDEGADASDVMRLGTELTKGVLGYGSPPDPRAEPLPAGAVTRLLRTLTDAFPFVVVDATSEYADHVLAAFDLSDAICLISGLDAIGVRHMSIGMHTLEKLGVPRERIRVVLNRANSRVDLTPEDVERLLAVTVDARIPSSPLVPRSINRGRLLYADDRGSDVARAIERFADRLYTDFIPEETNKTNNGNGHKRRLLRRG